jgi:UDP-glucose 4-epimerase
LRVLVTGGSGFIGSHTLVDLCAHGHEVLVVDNFHNSSPEVLNRVSELTQCEIPYQELDIRDEARLDGVMKEFRPESVIHFAGLKAVGEGEEKPLEYYSVNVSGTGNVLAAMDRHGCKRIIFSSSATVYGEPQYLPLDEAHPCGPVNVYGHTKRTAELLLDSWQKAHGNASVVALRYFNPVGAHSSARIGESPRGVPNNLMPFVAQVAMGMRPDVRVFGDDYDTPDGTGMRDYIHVEDLARAHTAALSYSQEKSGYAVFNVGTGKAYSVLEIIREFSCAAGCDIPYKVTARRPGDAAQSVANPEMANRYLNWKARFGLDEMCQTHWNWQRQKSYKYSVKLPE